MPNDASPNSPDRPSGGSGSRPAGGTTLHGFLPAASGESAARPRTPTGPGYRAAGGLSDERRLLALLYRVALRCLEARGDAEDIEGVLVTALLRGAGGRAAFVVRREAGDARVRGCEAVGRLDRAAVALLAREALSDEVLVEREIPPELAALGLPGRWLTVAPVGEGGGALGVTSERELSDGEIELVAQLAAVARAALR